MNSIDDLHKALKDILGSSNVYFQPPESFKLNYPCIVFTLATPKQKYANNYMYMYYRQFELTYIRKDADLEDFSHKLASSFSMIREGSTYKADNLYHTKFYLYF